MTAHDPGSDRERGPDASDAGDVPLLEAGAVVEVMNPFTGEWRNGFVVVAGDELGYVLSREDSHGARTPPIPAPRVRAAEPH